MRAGLITAIAMLLVYACTAPHVVSHEDMAEFQTLAATGGIAHAGYPLLVVALRIFGLLPIATVAWRANLLSAFAGAIAASLAAASAARIGRSSWIGAGCGLALGLSYTMWMESTRAEAHAFTLAIGAGLFLAVLAYRDRPDARRAALAGLLCGAGLVSHLSVLGLVTPVAIGALWWWMRGRMPARHVVAAAIGLGIGLSSLAVLVYYDRPGHPMNYIEQTFSATWRPGAPLGPGDHLARLFALLSGHQFLEGWFHPFKDSFYRLRRLGLDLWLNEFFLLGLPLAVIGLIGMARARERGATLLAAWLGFTILWLLIGAFPMVVTSFFLPGLWALSQGMAWSVAAIRTRSAGVAALVLALLVAAPLARLGLADPPGPLGSHPVVAGVWHMMPAEWSPLRPDRSWDHDGRAALAMVEPRAIVLSCWEPGTTLRYLRLAEGVRPDIEVRLTCNDPAQIERARQEARRSARPVYLTFDPAEARLGSAGSAPLHAWAHVPLWRLD